MVLKHLMDRMRNERIRETTKLRKISKKMQERRLKRYGHVIRRDEEYVGKRALVMDVPEKNWKGRRKWMRDLLHVRRKTLPYHDH